MPKRSRHPHIRRARWSALLTACLLITPLMSTAPVAAQQEESRLLMRIYVESRRTCPVSNIAGYTSMVIEGKGVPDADGYIPATVHAITDLVRQGNLTLHTSHFENDYPLAVRLEAFPTGLNTSIQILDFESLTLDPKPTALMCSYIDGDGSTKQIHTDEDTFHRIVLNTSKNMFFVLDGLTENAEGVLGVEGLATNGIGLIKIAAQWFPGKPWAAMDVEPDAKGLFINNVAVDINMDYIPNWSEPARYDGIVTVKPGPLPVEKINQPAPAKVRRTLKPAGMQPGSTPAEGYVELNAGGTSSNRASAPFRVSGPQLVVKEDEVGATKSNNEVVYKYERAIPKEPWKKEFSFGASFPPPLRNKDIKASAQVKILFETTSLMPPATIKPGFGGEGEVTLGKVAGKLGVEGNAELKIDEAGVDFVQGNGKADFQIGVKSEYSAFDLVPQIQPVAAAVGLDGWVKKYLRAEAGLYGIAVGQLVVYKKDGLQWKAQVQPGVRVIAKGIIGAEGGDIGGEIEAKGEGRLNFFLNDPDKAFYGGGDGEVTFAVALSFFNNKFVRETKYSFGGSLASMGQTLRLDGPAVGTLASAGYVGGEQWHVVQHASQPVALGLLQAADSRVTLVAQAHPNAKPAMDPTGKAACWVSAHSGVVESRNTEITCATGNDLVSAMPQRVTHDALADASPAVAMAAANTPVATWWRHDDPALPISPTLDADYLRHGEVMASVYDPAAVKWTTPITLGTPGVLDYDPVVAGDSSTGAVVIWRANTAGQIGGLGNTPDTLKAATYSSMAGTWSAPQTVATLPGLVDVSAAYHSGEAAVLYTLDANTASTSTLSSEVWAQRQVTGAWQPAVQLSNNTAADLSPLAAYDATGAPVFVWLRRSADDESAAASLVVQRGWSGTPVVTAMPGNLAPAELRRMAVNAQGDVAVLWRTLSGDEGQQDLAYARFSTASQTWSPAVQLTNEADENRFASIAWSSANQITLLYDQVKLQTLTDTVVISGAAKPYTYTTPNPNGHNLVLHTVDVTAAQSAQAQDLSASVVNTPSLPELSIVSAIPDRELQVGRTVLRVKVANTGVISAPAVLVQVRDANGEIGSGEVAVTPTEGLLAGTTGIAYVPLDVSEVQSDTRAITVTVGLMNGQELNPANNTFELDWMRWPDWVVSGGNVVLGRATSAGTLITITAYNLSEVNAPAVKVAVYSDRPEDGGVLLWQGVLGEAEPLQRAKLSGLLPGAVTQAYVRVNPDRAIAELNSGNNDARLGGIAASVPTGFKIYLPALQR